MNWALRRNMLLGGMILRSPEGEGAGGAGDASGGDGGGDTSSAAATATLVGGEGSEGEESTPEGDAPKEGEESTTSKEGEAGEATPFEVSAPEGMENFQDDFSEFNTDVNKFLSENPDVSAADALKWAAERQAGMVSEQAQAYAREFTEKVDSWGSETMQLPEFSGDKGEENLSIAKLAIEKHGGQELMDILNETGLGSNPHFVSFAYKAGVPLMESPIVKTNGGEARKSLSSLYE